MNTPENVITPESFYLKTWKVISHVETDVRKGELIKIDKSDGHLHFSFPQGIQSFGDGQWGAYQNLRYIPELGVLSCDYEKTRRGPVSVTISKLSNDEIRCVIAVEPAVVTNEPVEEPGEWTAEEEGGP